MLNDLRLKIVKLFIIFSDQYVMKIIFIYLILSIFITACSIDASITATDSKSPEGSVPEGGGNTNRTTPDFINAEIVMDNSGQYEFHASFGETTEKVQSGNYIFEAVFYQ